MGRNRNRPPNRAPRGQKWIQNGFTPEGHINWALTEAVKVNRTPVSQPPPNFEGDTTAPDEPPWIMVALGLARKPADEQPKEQVKEVKDPGGWMADWEKRRG